MKIHHRISFNTSINTELLTVITQLKIKHKITSLPGKSPIVFFDINEDDVNWELLKGKLVNVTDVFQTSFTEEEILNSDWIRIVPLYPIGFPEPQDTWVEDKNNYEVICRECGTYLQKKEYRIKAEPELHGNDFATLHWTYSLFCTNEVIGCFTKQDFKGYDIWDLINNANGFPTKKLKQLFVLQEAKPGLINSEGLDPIKCPSCQKVKYKPHMRGFMNMDKEVFNDVKGEDILYSYEWFGHLKAAYKEIFISNRVGKIILSEKWKGALLKPIKLL
jgi:hypothetical protein